MFSSGNDDTSRDDFVQPKMAASALNAILKTSIQCNDYSVYSVTDLLKDCMDPGLRRIDDCFLGPEPDTTYYDQDYQSYSCPLAEHMISEMLRVTFNDKYKLPVYFFATPDSSLSEKLFISYPGTFTKCDENSRQRDPGLQSFTLSTGNLEIQLGICY